MSKIFLEHCKNSIDTIQEFKDSCFSLKELCKILGYSDHGRNTSALLIFCKQNNIDISHFTPNGRPPPQIIKTCLNCGSTFETVKGKKGRQTCSRACANKYFKQAAKDANINTYARVAKQAGMISCCICGESEVLDIHHLDNDRDNNCLDNLIPLCPTHHMYLHRGKEDMIFDKIVQYLDTRVLLE